MDPHDFIVKNKYTIEGRTVKLKPTYVSTELENINVQLPSKKMNKVCTNHHHQTIYPIMVPPVLY